MSKLRTKITKHFNKHMAADLLLGSLTLVGFIALVALIYYQVRPMQLININVPVATDKTEYAAGDPIYGIFFGEVYYEGKTEVLRKLVCHNYRSQLPDFNPSDDDDTVATVSTPRKLDGVSVYISDLPNDAPVGEQCTIEFVNDYQIQTPFGVRHEERSYYTQGFNIAANSKESDQVRPETPCPNEQTCSIGGGIITQDPAEDEPEQPPERPAPKEDPEFEQPDMNSRQDPTLCIPLTNICIEL